MAVVKGVKEQVHLPLYDCVEVKPGKQLGEILSSNILRFFVDVNRKTKLLTNMQAASLLPHWNTFEARALRVVISDLCPEFSGDLTVEELVTLVSSAPTTVSLVMSLRAFIGLKRTFEAQPGITKIDVESQNELTALGLKITQGNNPSELQAGETLEITRSVLDSAEIKFKALGNGRVFPPGAQIFPNNGCGTVISRFIYNTVTTFFVGEKIMIQVPTWFFPAGAGPYSENGGTVTHGYPNPQATFRFAEPVLIETQQNFRVEIEVPESDILKELQSLYGPLFIWVVLDGYMTRDVQ